MNAIPISLPPRGACPSLEAPMAVADGLLVRLRPARGWLTHAELAALGEAAEALGNGRVEISLRGSLQLRGFTPEGVDALRRRVDNAGLAVATGLVIERSPIAGRDPAEAADPRPLIAALEAKIADLASALAPKLSLVVSAGGQYDPLRHRADIGIGWDGPGTWRIGLDTSWLGLAEEAAVPALVRDMLLALRAQGPGARAKDLDADLWRQRLDAPASAAAPSVASPPQPGPMGLFGGGAMHALALPFGQCRGEMLMALAGALTQGVEIHPAPNRHLVLIAADHTELEPALRVGAARGLWITPEAPGLRLPLCSGAHRIGATVIHTADIARLWMEAAPEAFDGSLHLHSATCARGCGFRDSPGVRLAPDADRLALHAHEDGTRAPLAWVRETTIEKDLTDFARRLAEARHERQQ